MSNKFTNAEEKVVRINHSMLGQELRDIAEDCDVPLQWVFDAFTNEVVERTDIDAILVKIVAECENRKEQSKDIPY